MRTIDRSGARESPRAIALLILIVLLALLSAHSPPLAHDHHSLPSLHRPAQEHHHSIQKSEGGVSRSVWLQANIWPAQLVRSQAESKTR